MAWLFGVGVLILMTVFCRPGESVKCYLCSTKDNETMCLYPKSYDLPLIKCDQQALENTRHFARWIDQSYDKIFEVDTSDMAKHMDLNCLKVVTKLGNKLFTFRGCQLAEQSNLDICVKMKKANTDYLKKQYCSRCSTDGCNAANTLFGQVYYWVVILLSTILFLNL